MVEHPKIVIKKSKMEWLHDMFVLHENAKAFYRNALLTISWLKFETTLYFTWLSKKFIDSAGTNPT
ncbi:hypothetical protein SAMN06264849_1067 [Melghirimyces algeriensis]|uniref:Uncharacterized protein n=1 Tax=Melghirimyces algeriensis TaxID=910412 RepID=A0A521DDN0_9BACL|nr:hypothetical protein SAMN06264849_1067 [Melghirimyces algeriensis]